MKTFTKLAALAAAAILTGCVNNQAPYDYTAFKASNPRSILVLPPINESVDVNAVNGMLARTTLP